MKTRSFLLLCVLFIANAIYGQNYYMYIDGKKRTFEVVPNRVLVQYFDSSIDYTQVQNTLQRMAVSPKNVTRIHKGFLLVELEDTSREQITRSSEQWNVFGENAYLSSVVVGKDGIEISFILNQIIVRLKTGDDYAFLSQQLRPYNVKAIELADFGERTYLVTLNHPQQKSSLQIANELHRTGLFEYAEPDIFHFVKRNAVTVNDDLFTWQWGLHDDVIGIRAPQAWTITTGSPNIRVAVIDTGVDLGHPDLAANLLSGFNAYTGALNGNVHWEVDRYEHGTACAGIIGAIANNYIGLAGVAHNSRIIPIHDGRTTAQIASAVSWAIENGADVISISSSYAENNTLNNQFARAATAGRDSLGIVIVASSGNHRDDDGEVIDRVDFPARRADVIAVGAIVQGGHRWSNSRFGVDLDIVAPGGGYIITTDVRDGIGPPGQNGASPGWDYRDNFGGTSAAAPHVAGVAALILSVNPDLTAQEVRSIIKRTAQRVRPDLHNYSYNDVRPRYNGTWSPLTGHGLVDAYAAVKAALETLSSIIGPDFITPFGTYTISTGQPAEWSITHGFILDISPCSTSVTVKPRAFDGMQGTLTAVVNGVTLTKDIRHAFIAGNGVVSTPTNFRLNTNQTATWSVTPEFRITTSNVGATVTVAPVNANSFFGTVTATLADGTTIRKGINTRGNAGMNVVMWLTTNRRNPTPNFRAVFRPTHTPSGATFPTERNIITGNFNHPTGYFSNSVQVESGTFFTEAFIFLYGDRHQPQRVRYNVTVQVLNHYEDGYVHVQYRAGEAFIDDIDAYQIIMFDNGWREPYNGNWATMVVSLHVEVLESPLRSSEETTIELSVYPNPTFSVLNVKVEDRATETLQPVTNYDVRLYDNQGNLLRRSTTTDGYVQFNVINLPNGSYFLHVHDGVNSTPIKRQVMIER